MLYILYEAQHMALAPLRFWAEMSRGWFGHPFSPFIYLPHADPRKNSRRSYQYVGDGWWSWREEG